MASYQRFPTSPNVGHYTTPFLASPFGHGREVQFHPMVGAGPTRSVAGVNSPRPIYEGGSSSSGIQPFLSNRIDKLRLQRRKQARSVGFESTSMGDEADVTSIQSGRESSAEQDFNFSGVSPESRSVASALGIGHVPVVADYGGSTQRIGAVRPWGTAGPPSTVSTQQRARSFGAPPMMMK
jgi:hypothetical protein